jgi:ATP-binding cassette subfamily C protein
MRAIVLHARITVRRFGPWTNHNRLVQQSILPGLRLAPEQVLHVFPCLTLNGLQSEPSSVTKQQNGTRAFFAFFLRGYPARTALMVALMFLGGLAEGVGVLALVPVLEFGASGREPSSAAGKLIVSGVRSIGLEPTLGLMLLGIVLAIALKSMLLWLADLQVGVTVARVTRDLRANLISALFAVKWGYFAKRQLGQFANAVTIEAVRVAAAYREACLVLAAFMQMAVYFAIAAMISWRIAVGTMVAGLALTAVYRGFFRRGRAAGGAETDLSKALTSRLLDVLQGLKPLKAMGREYLIRPFLEAETEGLNRAQRQQVLVMVSLKALQEPILTIMLCSGLYFLLHVSGHEMSSVLVLAFVFYRLMQHIGTIQVRYQVMTLGESAFASLVQEIQTAGDERETAGGAVKVTGLHKAMRFEDVTFAYDEREILDRATFEIPAGSFIALTGGSGAGKTTIADLIVGLIQPQNGRITIDGVPLDDIALDSWRRTIGYVPQEMLLLNDTVYRNVTLGDESVPRAEVERALRLAGAWDFVQRNPHGLDHRVGERGTSLSGGQRQRLAIARALLGNPSLLILDEVTTALDPETEREICRSLRGLTPAVTIVSISHQAAMRDQADYVLMLEQGDIRIAPGTQSDEPTEATPIQ